MLYIELDDTLISVQSVNYIDIKRAKKRRRGYWDTLHIRISLSGTQHLGEGWQYDHPGCSIHHYRELLKSYKKWIELHENTLMGARKVIFNFDEVMGNIIKDGMPALDSVLAGFNECYREKEDDEE